MREKQYDLQKIIEQFNFQGQFVDATPYGYGHINDTYALNYQKDGKHIRYILQRINHEVFKWPEQLMNNIHLVTAHLREKITACGGDINRQTLNLLTTSSGKYYYKSDNGLYWRSFHFIEGASTYQLVTDPNQFYHVGKAFGCFQRWLQDFPIDVLHESIIAFHDTRKRYNDLENAIEEDARGRVKAVGAEIEFARNCYQSMKPIIDGIREGEVPLRVTHNDTKLNNIMLDDVTGEGICVIDLDTVMPGTVLSDFGDSIRFGASTALEDEQDLDLVKVDMDLFEHYTKGFLEEAAEILTPKEIDYLAVSGKLMAFECGTRFLEDHLRGDTYFKTSRVGHNLDRCRNQFRLYTDMDNNYEDMVRIINKYRSMPSSQKRHAV